MCCDSSMWYLQYLGLRILTVIKGKGAASNVWGPVESHWPASQKVIYGNPWYWTHLKLASLLPFVLLCHCALSFPTWTPSPPLCCISWHFRRSRDHSIFWSRKLVGNHTSLRDKLKQTRLEERGLKLHWRGSEEDRTQNYIQGGSVQTRQTDSVAAMLVWSWSVLEVFCVPGRDKDGEMPGWRICLSCL